MEKEKKAKYLYGASVQGIQDFIFQTNKLAEIVGASELVEKICSSEFDEFTNEKEPIVKAAGKIVHIFDSKEDCEKAVYNFPRKVMNIAPGITISQSVVAMEGDFSDYEKASGELEKRLRIQRNKPVRSMTLGLMVISRSQRTGLPAIEDKDGLVDEASAQKTKNPETTIGLMKKLVGDSVKHAQIAYDFSEMEGKNSWIAVIHADGNGLGDVVQEVCKNEEDAQTFSGLLDEITKAAARKAFSELFKKNTETATQMACKSIIDQFNDKNKIPIRPVVLGGDDLTVICRADLAVNFTKSFLEKFEEESKSKLNEKLSKYDILENGLTACAGIAFVKSSYPFHYAVELAENLCKRAKKAAKEIDKKLAPSCLMFHKVQDSFVEDFSEIAKRELTPQAKLSFEYGPYYCGNHPKQPDNTIEKLLEDIKNLEGKEGNAIKSHLRQWLSLLFDNVDAANQKMKRLRTVNKKAANMIPSDYEDVAKVDKIRYHDILSLASIIADTKKEGESDE